jgi:putative sigma-54 modulation protein
LVQINISTRHGRVNDNTQAAIREKIDRLIRLYDRITAIELTINLEHPDAPAVDLRMSAKKHDFLATGQSGDLLASVDVVVDKMEQQLRKHKEKVQDRHRSTGHRQAKTSGEFGKGRNQE